MRQSPEAVELRPVTVSARHPFHVRGRVEIDRQWAWAEQLDPDGAPRVEVRERGEALWRPLAISPPTRSEWPDAVDTAAPRSFAWSCATPHAQIEFRALLTKQDRSVVERLVAVTPSADGTQDVRLAFP
jgi:hypothetical protein